MFSARRLDWSAALGLVVLLAACGREEPEAPAPPNVVIVETLRPGSSEEAREWPGLVEVARGGELSFATAGRLQRVLVSEGQAVRRGQLLAVLDVADADLRLREGATRLAQAEADLLRRSGMQSEGVVSPAEVQRVRAETEALRANVAQLRLEKGRTRLVAPESGVIGRVAREPGTAVLAGDPVLTLVDQRTIEVVIAVPETAVLDQSLRPGAKAEGTLSARPDLRFPLTVVEREAAAAEGARTWQIRLRGTQPQDGPLPRGISVRVRFTAPETRAAEQATVALSALVDRARSPAAPGGKAVWLVDQATGAVRQTPVSVGGIINDRAELLTPLPDGARVVVVGAHALKNGQRVRAMERR